MKDSWESGEAYEYFMGRWSRLVASSFLDWLAPSHGLHWLDVGCGSGALSEAILKSCQPEGLTAIDQSAGFVSAIAARLGHSAECRVGDALALPLGDSTVDATVSGLVLNFISDKQRAIAEMVRVTRPGGFVAVYIWDYAGTMEFLTTFWDAVVEIDPDASHLHEANRFPTSTAETLRLLFEDAGLENVENAPITIVTHFANFEDYWNPLLGGQGPAPSYVQSLDESKRARLRNLLRERLPFALDGSIAMTARAWAAKGQPAGARPSGA